MLVEWFEVDLILGAWKLVNAGMAEDWRLLLFDDQKSDGMRRGRKAPLYLTNAFFERKQFKPSLNSSGLALQNLDLLFRPAICQDGYSGSLTWTNGEAVDMSHAMATPLT